MNELKELEEKLGYQFSDIDLLKQALMHSSYVNEKGRRHDASNERLEFLGDAVLEMTVSHLLYKHLPLLSEGEMTKIRAKLVCEQSLNTLALSLDLGTHLLLGRGESNAGGRNRPSILADAFEAITAAIYLDGGLQPALNFTQNLFGQEINKPSKDSTDYKTILQELIQDKHGMSYQYKLINEQGPDHDKTFTVELLINGKQKSTGTGKSKKSAEQAAAKDAIEIFKEE